MLLSNTDVVLFLNTNRGIGTGIALRLARDGAKVVVNYVKDKKSADAVVATIKTIAGSDAIAIQGDASLSTDVDRLFNETKKAFGRVDIVVANAGIATGNSMFTLMLLFTHFQCLLTNIMSYDK
jgi:3-oxoacyl-[acyl-carrier protein] reductase